MFHASWNVINVGQIEIGVRGWILFSHVLLDDLRTGFPVALLHLWFCWFGLVRNEILQSPNPKDREREIQSMRKPVSREITSASVELCETEVCFLHIQLIGTNV